MTEQDTTLEALIAEGKRSKVVIQGREFIIGKLTLVIYFRLSKLIVKVGKRYADVLAHFKPTANDAGDIIKFMGVLDERDLLDFLQILLPETDDAFCAQVDGDETLELVTAICRHNDFKGLLKKARGVTDQFKDTPSA